MALGTPPSKNQHWIHYSAIGGLLVNVTRYLRPSTLGGSGAVSVAEDVDITVFSVPSSGVLKNLCVHVDPAPGAGESVVVTVRRNLAASALTVTIAGAVAKNGQMLGSLNVAAGDVITLQAVNSVLSAVTNLSADLLYEN
jgi:hypothetical protein